MVRLIQVTVLAAFFGVVCDTAYAQCALPELVKGADSYNTLVCKADQASRDGDNQRALELLLQASEQPVLESPNIRLFGQIARVQAKLGHFTEADRYFKYDNLSILWMIGIVRCREASGSSGESLFQDGKPLTDGDAKHMVSVLCGPAFDEFSYFRDRDTESFVPAAKAILQHASLRNEIDTMRDLRRSRP